MSAPTHQVAPWSYTQGVTEQKTEGGSQEKVATFKVSLFVCQMGSSGTAPFKLVKQGSWLGENWFHHSSAWVFHHNSGPGRRILQCTSPSPSTGSRESLVQRAPRCCPDVEGLWRRNRESCRLPELRRSAAKGQKCLHREYGAEISWDEGSSLLWVPFPARGFSSSWGIQ